MMANRRSLQRLVRHLVLPFHAEVLKKVVEGQHKKACSNRMKNATHFKEAMANHRIANCWCNQTD